jgi:hypothetical protein
MQPEFSAKTLGDFASLLTSMLLPLVAASTVTVALLEAVKGIVPLRSWYQRTYIRRWSGKAFPELLILAASGPQNSGALFNQQSSKMFGQIQAAANIALDSPSMCPTFYKFVTALPGLEDRDQRTWWDFTERVAAGEQLKPAERQEDSVALRSATQARARLEHVVARTLDSLQTRLEFFWSRANQVAAVVLASWLLHAFVVKGFTLTNLAYCIVGGMVSPVAKDLVAALSGVRSSRT